MKKIIFTTSLFALFAGAVMATEVKLESQSNVEITQESSASGRIAGNFSSQSVLMDGISYEDISLSLVNANKGISTQLHGGITRITAGTLTVNNTTFKDINMHSQYQVQGGAIYVNSVGAKAVITGSTFDSITSSNGDYTGDLTYASFAMGGAIISWESDLDISDTTFYKNKVVAGSADKKADGGAVYLRMSSGKVGENVSFNRVTFNDNHAVNEANAVYSRGGAVQAQGNYYGVKDESRSLVFQDSMFTNNSAGRGGAIHSFSQSMTFKVSSGNELAYTGNQSLTGDEGGGFLMLNSNSSEETKSNIFATFEIGDGARLTIGNANSEAGFDSIASIGEAGSTSINKTGNGSLVVNGSMEYFAGVLNVNEGSMVVNSTLGASDIVIASGATLTLGDDTDIILYGCSITLAEGATLELGANSTITVNLEEDFTGTTNLITLAEGATLSQEGESVTLASLQDNMTVTYKGQELDKSQWSFDAETGELKSAVPEPSTYAMIFGAIALGFVAYRRRK